MPRSRARSKKARRVAAGILDARGVVGRDQHDGPGARVDQPLGLGGVRDQALAGGQAARRHPGLVEPHLVIEVPRKRQDRVVAGPGQRRHRRREGLVAPRGDRDLRRGHDAAIELRPSCREGLPKRGQPQVRPVEMRARVLGDEARHLRPHGLRRRGHGRRLADVDQRPIGRKAQAPRASPWPRSPEGARCAPAPGKGAASRAARRPGGDGSRERRARGAPSPARHRCRGRAGRIAAPCPTGRRSRCPG